MSSSIHFTKTQCIRCYFLDFLWNLNIDSAGPKVVHYDLIHNYVNRMHRR